MSGVRVLDWCISVSDGDTVQSEGVGGYRECSDARVGPNVAWDALPFARLQADAYILVYVRTSFWSDSVGDGIERTPYACDSATVDVARQYFLGQPAVVALDPDVGCAGAGSVHERLAEQASGSGM